MAKTSSRNLDAERFDFEKDVKLRELQIAENAATNGGLSTPQVTLIAAILSLVSSLGVSYFGGLWETERTISQTQISSISQQVVEEIKGSNASNIEKIKIEGNLKLENFRLHKELITRAIDTDNQISSRARLKFFADAGLLGEYKDGIVEYINSTKVEDFVTLKDSTTLERVLADTGGSTSLSYINGILKLAKSVGKIDIIQDDKTKAVSTGFLLSGGLMITANHVLPTIESAQQSTITLGYDSDSDAPATIFPLAPDDFFFTSVILDYTIVAVGSKSSDGNNLSEFGFISLKQKTEPEIDDVVSVIHHPLAHPKEISLRSGKIVDLPKDRAHYITDTSPGSAGAPVIDDELNLIAINLARVPETSDSGQVLSQDGKPWNASKPAKPPTIRWVAKEGILASSIYSDLVLRKSEMSDNQLKKINKVLHGN